MKDFECPIKGSMQAKTYAHLVRKHQEGVGVFEIFFLQGQEQWL